MIYFLGDVHGNFDRVLPAIEADLSNESEGETNVIFLGDIESQRPFEVEVKHLIDAGVGVWFIHGNHDTDSVTNWKNLEGSQHRNLHGRVVEIEGVRVAGLGGIFRGEVWYPDHHAMQSPAPVQRNYADYEKRLRSEVGLKRRLSKMDMIRRVAVPSPRSDSELLDQSHQGKLLKHLSSIFPDTYNSLADLKADVLVTHEAPSCHKHGFQSLDVLAKSMGVKKLFHGHHHDRVDYQASFERLGFDVFGVGFCGITDHEGQCVMPGDFDQQQLGRR